MENILNYNGLTSIVIIIQMGVTCCQTTSNASDFDQMNKLAYLSEYVEANWSQDQDLHSQLKISNMYSPQERIKSLKHKVYDRWFWGTWKDGSPYGRGILFNKLGSDSIYYEGQFKGEPNGQGKVVFNGGQWEYNGQVQKGKANGSGKMINRKQGYQFEGEWKDSKPDQGNLTLYSNFSRKDTDDSFNKSKEIQGNIIVEINKSSENDKTVIRYPDGKVYIGEINKTRFIPEGKGQIVFPNKSKFIGEWSDGQMHGQGKFQWEDGSCYQGEYKYGKKQGTGKFTFASGNFYKGFWLNGKQHGKGILYDKNGDELKNGYWKQGVFQGKSNPEE